MGFFAPGAALVGGRFRLACGSGDGETPPVLTIPLLTRYGPLLRGLRGFDGWHPGAGLLGPCKTWDGGLIILREGDDARWASLVMVDRATKESGSAGIINTKK